MSLNKITPQDILKLVKFNIEENNDWKYDATRKDMYAYQAEGSAGIWNRLEHFGLAILADEVGMGKTYQALAVVAKQFQIKPDSTILIITPRYEVLRQWKEEEYEQFKQNHLINKKLLPSKEKLGELPNLSNGFFSQNYKTNNSKIIFMKTTSFSQNIDFEKSKNIKKFDLVIVDEAHKYRTFKKSSTKDIASRNINAHNIFKNISTKILLMTATPLHSKKSDIVNIVNVFKPNIFMVHQSIEKTPESIMQNLMIRRLRVMAGNYNKYHYREEKDLPVDISSKETDYKNELFFAMLQREMIKDKNYSKSKNMLDLLEGTTFDENYNKENNKDIDEKDKDKRKDESKVKKIFINVVSKFQENYQLAPSNQKYLSVLKQIQDDKEKALVFVRRRASAIELTRQYIDSFDKKWWKYLTGNDNYPKKLEDFNTFLGNKIPQSKIYKFINTKYVQKEYGKNKDIAILYFSEYDKLNQINFDEFCSTNKVESSDTQEDETSKSLPKSYVLSAFKNKTLASLFVKKFEYAKGFKDAFFETFLPEQLGYIDQNDSFKKMVKSAILHASCGVIELFKCYYELEEKSYAKFKQKVKSKINTKKIENRFIFVNEITSFIKSFDKWKKYLKKNNNQGNGESENYYIVTKDDEKIFYNSQPAYPYLSNTKNKSVIARFNSPFFPNLLCGTSTLQEGLNLHLQCNKIYHFGSAHTMGDDEQRIGRVDRIHGKMYRELKELEDNNKEKKDAKLNVHYPYLKSTYDEENLRNMLCSKRATEKKIDRCQIEANINDVKKIITKNQCEKPIEQLIYKSNSLDTHGGEGEPFSWKMKNVSSK